MPIMHFILDKISKLLTLHAFLSLVVAELSDLKNRPFFWPTRYFDLERTHVV